MKITKEIARSITRDALLSVLLYALPVVLMLVWFYFSGQRPWVMGSGALAPGLGAQSLGASGSGSKHVLGFLGPVFRNLNTWGLPVLMVVVGVAEWLLGLYKQHWTRNEWILDVVCFTIPVPFLWRFHRTHHSAPYMGMAMASRQNIIYTIFFSQIYLTAALTYLGLGEAALLVTGVKSMITLAAHSSIAWDKPFYRHRWLHPVAWVLERTISTPATHHAHHADSDDDGVGHYKGNFGNMFFLWDVIFGTGIITRQYPSGYGIKHYKQEEWYAQFLWPLVKSGKEGSELAHGGPVVGDEVGSAAAPPTVVESKWREAI